MLAPGELPRVTSMNHHLDDIWRLSVNDVPRATFEAVRDDAMRRGDVDEFDRNAVNMLMWSTFQRDGAVRILVQLTRDDASAGTYSARWRIHPGRHTLTPACGKILAYRKPHAPDVPDSSARGGWPRSARR